MYSDLVTPSRCSNLVGTIMILVSCLDSKTRPGGSLSCNIRLKAAFFSHLRQAGSSI